MTAMQVQAAVLLQSPCTVAHGLDVRTGGRRTTDRGARPGTCGAWCHASRIGTLTPPCLFRLVVARLFVVSTCLIAVQVKVVSAFTHA